MCGYYQVSRERSDVVRISLLGALMRNFTSAAVRNDLATMVVGRTLTGAHCATRLANVNAAILDCVPAAGSQPVEIVDELENFPRSFS